MGAKRRRIFFKIFNTIYSVDKRIGIPPESLCIRWFCRSLGCRLNTIYCGFKNIFTKYCGLGLAKYRQMQYNKSRLNYTAVFAEKILYIVIRGGYGYEDHQKKLGSVDPGDTARFEHGDHGPGVIRNGGNAEDADAKQQNIELDTRAERGAE